VLGLPIPFPRFLDEARLGVAGRRLGDMLSGLTAVQARRSPFAEGIRRRELFFSHTPLASYNFNTRRSHDGSCVHEARYRRPYCPRWSD
jgi:hypothetical protein